MSQNGVVTLGGEVAEESHRRLAQETVAGLPGVASVDNYLVVRLEGTERSDASLGLCERSFFIPSLSMNFRETSSLPAISSEVREVCSLWPTTNHFSWTTARYSTGS